MKVIRTLVGVVEANALHNLTNNVVVVGLGSGGDLTEDVDHTSGDGSLCEVARGFWSAREGAEVRKDQKK